VIDSQTQKFAPTWNALFPEKPRDPDSAPHIDMPQELVIKELALAGYEQIKVDESDAVSKENLYNYTLIFRMKKSSDLSTAVTTPSNDADTKNTKKQKTS